ncbi:hypothetical protein KJA13_00290 [Patescibacteria group bacterium]|nr:hypothetical protein [Patescibacteria group bacterium]
MKKFIFIIIILCIALGAAGFWYWQRNPYSKEILKLEILGPGEAAIFQEVEYTVKYKNNGNVRLEEPRLIFEFPEYTLLEEGLSRRQEIGPEELGDIYPGEEKTLQFKGRLFGKEGDIKTAKAWLSYRPKNLQARYESTTTFTTEIKFVPLTFDFDLSSKIEAGRDFKFSLNYYSSLDYPLSNLGIKIEYPSGFEFLESDPQGLAKTEWELSLLNQAEGGRVEITGRLSGEVKEQKIFKATLGIWQEDEFVLLKEITRGVEITRPRLFVFQRINGQSQYIANHGGLLHYEIFFRNIGEEPFTDLFLVATLGGRGFDLETVKADSSQFKKGDNSIIWDWRDVPKLRFLGQGEEGKVEFWINLKDEWEISSPQEKNAILKNTVLISQIKEEFETKINSKLAISQRGYYQEEVFGNSGPIPPEVGEATTYTIIWQAKNYFNDVKNVKVKAVLPSNVRLTGKIFPEQESSKFAFDIQSREIIWMVRDNQVMETGTGVLNPAPNIAFQVALTPTSGQKGKVSPIIKEAMITGEDQWTESFIEGTDSGIDTTLPDDSTVSSGQGIVQ